MFKKIQFHSPKLTFNIARLHSCCILLALICLQGFAYQVEENYEALDAELSNRNEYVNEKYTHIQELKDKANRLLLASNDEALYTTYVNLYEAYSSFQFDSAYYFLDKAKVTAKTIGDSLKIQQIKIKEGFVLMSSGLFKEAIDTLNTITVTNLNKALKFDYYAVKARTFYDLADYTADGRFSITYTRYGNKLLDSALQFTSKTAQNYWSTIGLKHIRQQEWDKAEHAFTHLINAFSLDPKTYAISVSSLAYVYDVMGKENLCIDYLIKAALTDVKAAIKETVALRVLASKLYEEGKIEKANAYINIAMEDANFYNARHRKMAISSILPIIEKAQILKTEEQKHRLTIAVIALSILAVAVVIFLIIIFKNLKERNASRKSLAENNKKLQELNTHLREADSVKQEYIAYFLRASSDFIKKIDYIQKSTLQKIITKRQDEAVKSLKKLSVKKERTILFTQFDEIFLKLFPNFKQEYYKLFPETEETILKGENTLNTEMRIFALYRLGVQDSHQVAEFLDLSVATIYTYKARIKSRSYYKKDFEDRIMAIKQLYTDNAGLA
ncbi:hypothetical protein SAMN05216480_104155 [Pustulibacterium marinum]|uniref:DUF6377 domain-containing protein n=1 Tax=Pustulibacterium marinum TaxID=1224947 RepID=A0A1I7GEM3_9FLAO|nr:DUF6377 domain-containing protein [Pustulibacterium marinum]SFU46863.1 hypothetical protein SAMN05216480_104155 [Pustulibacterium marinum]